ncbi:hypothetical protein [Bradyrhizobium jicamae]|uniref:hypothetical protein n=1 Tax=Bradyrhizobium jicamae TaxID=280332 RepID=UPI0018DE43F7|nr:hypothetical protein [Bradyrhizobium jicamae]
MVREIASSPFDDGGGNSCSPAGGTVPQVQRSHRRNHDRLQFVAGFLAAFVLSEALPLLEKFIRGLRSRKQA